MLEAYIKVEKELAAKGYKRGLWSKAVKDIVYYYAWRLFIVWLIVVEADRILDGSHLIFWHSIIFIVLLISASIYELSIWSKKMDDFEDQGYTAILDDNGVTIKGEVTENHFSWDSYKSYKEYDTYIQINFANEGMSMIPKTPELFEIIEFTKTKLPLE